MEMLHRLQPLDIVFALVWAASIGWGLQTGAIRQLGMLIGVYGAGVISGMAYRPIGQAMALPFGRESAPLLEFVAYLLLFVVGLGIIGAIVGKIVPLKLKRAPRGSRINNGLGAAVAAVWGALLLIVVLTMLRSYAAIPWRDQAKTQQTVLGEIQQSQVVPALEGVGAPLWRAMAAWFPAPVPRLV